MKNIILTFFAIFIAFQAIGQSEIIFTDGTTAKSPTGKPDSNGMVQILNKNNKVKLIDTTYIFAIVTNTDTTYYYSNADYPLDKAKMFVMGEMDGYKYKNNLVYAGAALTGFAAPFILKVINFYSVASPLISAIYVASTSGISTKNLPDSLKNNEDYIKGYKLAASRKKIKNTSILSVVGLATGIVVLIAITPK